MKNNRREFLKITGLAGAAVLTGCSSQSDNDPFRQTHRQTFNMSGYAAPKLETVRVGIIGMGSRGSSMVRAFTRIEGVEIKALCDLEPERVSEAIESIEGFSNHNNPDSYAGGENEWKKVCERNDIDLIYLCTPWHTHTPMAVFAMEHEKHVASERPIAVTVEECWQLVETSERTRRHCCNMTQSSHHGMAAVALNMARQGVFGEIIHCEGCYIHVLNSERYFYSKTQFHNMWRLNENATRNGNLYPDSGADTVSQILDINCGDKMDFMVSISSNDFSMMGKVKELADSDPFFEPYLDKNFRGNMNTSIIRTHKGRTIMIQHDVSSPRPRPENLDMVSGTKGIFMFHNQSPAIATSHQGWISDEELQSLIDEYTPEIIKRFDQLERQQQPDSRVRIRPMDWRLIDCLRNGLPLDMSLYDSALWSALGPLSEWSVANGGMPVEIPDFTSGNWETNKRGMDVTLQNGGGTTRLI